MQSGVRAITKLLTLEIHVVSSKSIASRDDPYERLRAIGIELPTARIPVGRFTPLCVSNGLVFVSGQGPVTRSGELLTGKVGGSISVEVAYDHARLVGVNLLAALHEHLGSLRKIEKIVKLLGFVNGTPDFIEHQKVINGCSDLMASVFGIERGVHACSVIGAGALPAGITVEIELVVELSRFQSSKI